MISRETVQPSIASGAKACASINPCVSEHSSVRSRLAATVIHDGGVLSCTMISIEQKELHS